MANQITEDILTVITLCSTADKDILTATLHPNANYVRNMITHLIEKGLLAYRGDKKKNLRLTAKGLELLKENNEASYNLYMQYSCNNRPPSDAKHHDPNRRLTGVVACMVKADIAVGTEKPSLEEVRTGQVPKMQPDKATFYMGKEARGDYGQQRSHTHKSRSTGYFFTPGLNALVYNAMDNAMHLNPREECHINIVSIYLRDSLYTINGRIFPPKDTLLFFKNDASALKVLNEPRPTNIKKNEKTLAEIVQDPTLLETEMRYIPTNETGIITLRILSKYTQEEILNKCFTADERAAAKNQGYGDAVINGLTVYEFISSNISKLMEIKNTADLSKTGIVCWEEQFDFITKFLAPELTYFRTIQKSAVLKAIENPDSPFKN